MALAQTLFGLRGRLNRAACIGYGFLSLAPLLVAAGALVGIRASGQGGAGTAIVVCAVVLPSLVAAFWMGVAPSVKRLHDMDMSGAHLVWIYIAPAVVGVAAEPAGAELLGTVAGFGITLWL